MKILQISLGKPPHRLASAGGDVGMFQNFCALTELGHEVHLAVLGPRTDNLDPDVRQRAAKVHFIEPRETPALLRPVERMLNPETFSLRFPQAHGFADALAALAKETAPDLIWADSTFTLSFAPRRDYPVVFGNYDFLFKLKAVRRDTQRRVSLADLRDPRALRRRFVRRPDAYSMSALEKFELKITSEAAHVMCVSASEADYCRAHGIAATHIPIVGPTIPKPMLEVPDRAPRFFLFGNHNTAHAAALSEIRRSLWPALERRGVRLEWHQIGKAPGRADDDWRWMEQTFDHVHGFVADLGDVFGLGDVSVVPYRHDTGFRTKFTVAAGYGVISAGYTETYLCAPEFKPGHDCISERDAEGLAQAFARVVSDREWRKSLGLAARKLYEREFTFEAQLPRYAAIVEAATAAGPLRQRAHG
jgi:glycosyltransferase involved in cell wall biosynthesis